MTEDENQSVEWWWVVPQNAAENVPELLAGRIGKRCKGRPISNRKGYVCRSPLGHILQEGKCVFCSWETKCDCFESLPEEQFESLS